MIMAKSHYLTTSSGRGRPYNLVQNWEDYNVVTTQRVEDWPNRFALEALKDSDLHVLREGASLKAEIGFICRSISELFGIPSMKSDLSTSALDIGRACCKSLWLLLRFLIKVLLYLILFAGGVVSFGLLWPRSFREFFLGFNSEDKYGSLQLDIKDEILSKSKFPPRSLDSNSRAFDAKREMTPLQQQLPQTPSLETKSTVNELSPREQHLEACLKEQLTLQRQLEDRIRSLEVKVDVKLDAILKLCAENL